ncbi:hypothetical protein BC739_000182 [Kutzneria viridogrisea]|uniref:Secreted protein n=3 Tax=Kutzneria TaxID=43356 RepID=W5WF30_9PSEU|nr:hypothetical protein [Kutzneria albida]AHH99457.1 hypothetical protein KALB_6097 [Kutzneria albida DSM 43870]MBA8922985.1 hypothetical protein [Kutzneria viridogrisea]
MKKTTQVLGCSAVVGFALLLGATGAQAAPSAPTDLSAAQQAASQAQTRDFVARFFVNVDQHSAGKVSALSAQAESAAAQAKAPQVVGEPLAVYTLSPDFVAGKSAEVAKFGYVAVHAKSATGQDASVWMVREGQTWSAMNVTTGTEEITYPARAGADTVFTEPQINAWYKVHEGRVLPLNEVARTSVGQGVSLAAYQKQVHDKYGDKLAGSAYQANKLLGGYSPSSASPAPAADTTDWTLLSAGAAIVLAAAGGVLALRRKLG